MLSMPTEEGRLVIDTKEGHAGIYHIRYDFKTLDVLNVEEGYYPIRGDTK